MPLHFRHPILTRRLLVFLLAHLLAGCAAPAPALLASATPPPLTPPTATSQPTLTPRPARTFIMPTVPLYGSKTPTPLPTMRPTVTPLAVKEFTMLDLRLVEGDLRLYRPITLAIETDGSAGNPFDPAQVDLSVRFSGPSGQKLSVPAFWYQDFDPQAQKPVGAPGWRARFTPPEAGEWAAEAVLSAPSVITSAPLRLRVEADPNARGFVRANKTNPQYFAFDNGDFYFPIGLNMGWSTGDVLADYTTWLDHLRENGGNFIRVWMASWSFAIEWDDTGLGNYSNRMKQAWLLDQVLRLAEERDIYVMLCLVNHGAFSKNTNPEWDSNPYNAALGGPLQAPEEFASSAQAKDLFKRRVRYIAARWAYSPNLAVWEWWNEAHWTPIPEKELMPWIGEMTAELKKYDPYDHLVSTSYGNGLGNKTWTLAEIDLAQQHEYSSSDPLESLPGTRRQLGFYAPGKPALLAEYGSSAAGETAPFNQGGIHLHNGLWAAPFSGYAGTGMYWWWDNYIEPQNLWQHYQGVYSFFWDENLKDYAPAAVTVTPAGAKGLALQMDDRALLWVRADGYTFAAAEKAYQAAGKNGAVPADWEYELPVQKGLRVEISGLKNGKYQAMFYSTLDGPLPGPDMDLTASGGTLVVPLPDLQTDLALKVWAVP